MLNPDFERAFDESVNKMNEDCERSLKFLREAVEIIGKAELKLINAADEVYDTPNDDRIRSLLMSLEDLECDVKAQIKRMESLT